MSHKKRGEHLMKCSPLFLTSPTGVWKESFRPFKEAKRNHRRNIKRLNPLSGKESFRRKAQSRNRSKRKNGLNPLSGKESFRRKNSGIGSSSL